MKLKLSLIFHILNVVDDEFCIVGACCCCCVDVGVLLLCGGVDDVEDLE